MSDPIPEIPPRMNKDIWETYVANRVWEKGVSYIVRKNGSYYEAINGSTGKISFGGPDKAGGVDGADGVAVAEAAMANAAGSATNPATIIILGDMTCPSCLDIPDYTTVFVRGRLLLQGSGADPNKLGITLGTQSSLYFDTIKQDDACDINILITSTGKGAENDVTITGKVLDGNLSNNTYAGSGSGDYTGAGISTYGDRWHINVQHIKDCGQYGGVTLHGKYNYVDVYVEGTTTLAGQTAKYASGVMVTSSISKGSEIHARVNTVDGAGVFLDDKTLRNIVFVTADSCGDAALLLEASSRNRIFIDATGCKHGVDFWNAVPGAEYIADNNLVFGVIKNSTNSGALLHGARENKFKVDFIDNAQSEVAGDDSSVYMKTANSVHCYRNSFAGSNFETADGKVDYHIEEEDNNQDYNDLRGCLFQGSPKTANVRWQGIHDYLYEIIVPFVDGTETLDNGYQINDTDEYARTFLAVPHYAQQVLAMYIRGRSTVTEADGMRCLFYVYGAGDNEGDTTHDGSTTATSTSTNFTALDVIYWTNTVAGVLALSANDSIRVKAIYAAASGDNCATDCVFRTVSLKFI